MALTLATTDTGDTTSIDGTQMQVPSGNALANGSIANLPTGTGTFAPFGTDQFGNPTLISTTPSPFGGSTLQALGPGSQFKANSTQAASDALQFGQLANFFGSFVRNSQDAQLSTPDMVSGTYKFSNPNTKSDLTLNINAGIDYALPEKQNTFGTPEYFRNIAASQENVGQNYISNQVAAAGIRNSSAPVAEGLFNVAAQGHFSEAVSAAQNFLSLGQATRNIDLQNQASAFLNHDFGATSSGWHWQSSMPPSDNSSASNAASLGFNTNYLSSQANYNYQRSQNPIVETSSSTNSPFFQSSGGFPQYQNSEYGNAAPNFLSGETFVGNGTGAFQSPVFHIGYGSPQVSVLSYPSTPTVRF